MWKIAIQNNITLKAAHLAAHSFELKRRSSIEVKGSTYRMVYEQGKPMINLFASKWNHKAQIFCSWIPDQKAVAINALSIFWDKMIGYAYPQYVLFRKFCHT